MKQLTLSGPMFEPAAWGVYESIFDKPGAHYNIYRIEDEDGMTALREMFPEQQSVNEYNFVFFSTSGIHGYYNTIEEAEYSLVDPNNEDLHNTVTFLILQPRICCLRYGNCLPQTQEDIAFLKQLRQWSWEAMLMIGKGKET